MKTEGVESTEQTKELKLCLRIAGLTLIPGNRAKASGAMLAISTVLRQNPAYTTGGGINGQVNGAIGGVVDRNKGGRMNDGVFEGLHGLVVLFCPVEGLPFLGEVD